MIASRPGSWPATTFISPNVWESVLCLPSLWDKHTQQQPGAKASVGFKCSAQVVLTCFPPPPPPGCSPCQSFRDFVHSHSRNPKFLVLSLASNCPGIFYDLPITRHPRLLSGEFLLHSQGRFPYGFPEPGGIFHLRLIHEHNPHPNLGTAESNGLLEPCPAP